MINILAFVIAILLVLRSEVRAALCCQRSASSKDTDTLSSYPTALRFDAISHFPNANTNANANNSANPTTGEPESFSLLSHSLASPHRAAPKRPGSWGTDSDVESAWDPAVCKKHAFEPSMTTTVVCVAVVVVLGILLFAVPYFFVTRTPKCQMALRFLDPRAYLNTSSFTTPPASTSSTASAAASSLNFAATAIDPPLLPLSTETPPAATLTAQASTLHTTIEEAVSLAKEIADSSSSIEIPPAA